MVRDGTDARLPPERDEDGKLQSAHTVYAVYREMLFQICRDYPGLPDPRTLTMREIRAFYEPLRADLKKLSKRQAE